MTQWKERQILRKSLRDFFDKHNYVEIETPVLVPCPGIEIHLDFFETQWIDDRKKARPLFMRSSPELHMKQAIAEGLERVYQIAPCFRNVGEYSDWHHPEFTMLEWYCSGSDLNQLMNETEQLVRHAHQSMSAGRSSAVEIPREILRLTVNEAFERFVGCTPNADDKNFAHKLKERGCHSVRSDDDFETAFFKAMYDRIEPELKTLGLCMLYDYPASTAGLAACRGGVARRFELYWNGIELCNGFEELLGGSENRQRFEDINRRRKTEGHQPLQAPAAFLDAMQHINKPLAGNAMGFERLLACLLGLTNIDTVVPFRREFNP